MPPLWREDSHNFVKMGYTQLLEFYTSLPPNCCDRTVNLEFTGDCMIKGNQFVKFMCALYAVNMFQNKIASFQVK